MKIEHNDYLSADLRHLEKEGRTIMTCKYACSKRFIVCPKIIATYSSKVEYCAWGASLDESTWRELCSVDW